MLRTLFLVVVVVSGLPMLAYGQSKSTSSSTTSPCCWTEAASIASPEQLRLETQQNLQGVLLQWSGGRRLTAGDYPISVSRDGYGFHALVSRQGIVDGWYLADPDGMPLVLIYANGGGSSGGGMKDCFAVYSKAVSGCAYLQNWPHRHQLCLDDAWDALIACMGKVNGGVIMR